MPIPEELQEQLDDIPDREAKCRSVPERSLSVGSLEGVFRGQVEDGNYVFSLDIENEGEAPERAARDILDQQYRETVEEEVKDLLGERYRDGTDVKFSGGTMEISVPARVKGEGRLDFTVDTAEDRLEVAEITEVDLVKEPPIKGDQIHRLLGRTLEEAKQDYHDVSLAYGEIVEEVASNVDFASGISAGNNDTFRYPEPVLRPEEKVVRDRVVRYIQENGLATVEKRGGKEVLGLPSKSEIFQETGRVMHREKVDLTHFINAVELVATGSVRYRTEPFSEAYGESGQTPSAG